MQLQKLGRKAFLRSGPKEFDLMLKGRFYQALLPKWQRKLGAPKTTESFEELYARTRTVERHDQQFNAAQNDSNQQKRKSKPLGKMETANKAEKKYLTNISQVIVWMLQLWKSQPHSKELPKIETGVKWMIWKT